MVIEVDKFLALTAKLAGFVPGAGVEEQRAVEAEDEGEEALAESGG